MINVKNMTLQEKLDFMKENKNKIFEVANKNTPRDKLGRIIIPKDDEWNDEPEWDEFYEDIK